MFYYKRSDFDYTLLSLKFKDYTLFNHEKRSGFLKFCVVCKNNEWTIIIS